MEFSCEQGHRFRLSYRSMSQGVWCRTCRHNAKNAPRFSRRVTSIHTGATVRQQVTELLQHMRQVCFSGPFKSDDPHLLAITFARQLARAWGGECLSDAYDKAKTPMQFRCGSGHTFTSTYHGLRKGEWCRACFNDVRRLDMAEIHKMAAVRGGKCLSTEYKNSTTKLLWQCAEGHTWRAVRPHVRAGTWCPECYRNQRQLNKGARKKTKVSVPKML